MCGPRLLLVVGATGEVSLLHAINDSVKTSKTAVRAVRDTDFEPLQNKVVGVYQTDCHFP